MKKIQRAGKKNNIYASSVAQITALFAAAFLVHVVLNMIVCKAPKMVIDEGLYTNIARSLAWEGKVAFRSQPVEYPFLLYPMLLVPLYWLNDLLGGDIYRYVQIFNTLLITSSVFPVYLFARKFTGEHKKAIFAALITALMPDMVLGGYEITEGLLWPLSLWMVYFAYRFFAEGEKKFSLLTGLFTGLMFATKPGAIACGVTVAVVFALMHLKKDKAKAKYALLTLAPVIATVLLVYGIYILVFGGSLSPLGLYDKQTSEWRSGDILVALEASLLMVLLFIFGCGGIFGLLPLFHLKQYKEKDRQLILAFTLGILAVLVGTAIFVVPYKWTGSLGSLPLHMRYLAMYVPAYIVFALGIDLPDKKINRGVLAAMGVFIVLCLFPGVRAGFIKGKSSSVDSVLLAAFHSTNRRDATGTGWIETIAMVLVSSFFLLSLKEGWKKDLKKLCCGFLALLTLYNATFACINANVPVDAQIASDAQQVNALTRGKTAVGVTQKRYDDIYSYWLDGRLNRPMQQVTADEMFVQMENTGGVYRPFVPTRQAPNVNNHETLDADTLVLGMTIAEHLELSEHVMSQKTANGHFTVVELEKGKPWVDSMMYGMDENTFVKDTDGWINVYNDNRNINGQLIITLTAYGEGTVLKVADQSVRLTEQAAEYEFILPYKREVYFTAEGGDAVILSYATKKNEMNLEA